MRFKYFAVKFDFQLILQLCCPLMLLQYVHRDNIRIIIDIMRRSTGVPLETQRINSSIVLLRKLVQSVKDNYLTFIFVIISFLSIRCWVWLVFKCYVCTWLLNVYIMHVLESKSTVNYRTFLLNSFFQTHAQLNKRHNCNSFANCD